MIVNRWILLAAAGLSLGGGPTASAQFGGIGGGRPDDLGVANAGTGALVALETPEKDGVKVCIIEGAEPHPITTPRVATVQYGDILYVFNAKFGRWDSSAGKKE